MATQLIPKSIQIIWNILNVVTDEYIKINEITHILREKYKMKVTPSYVSNIVADMSYYNFIDTCQGRGIKKSSTRKTIDFVEICEAMRNDIPRDFVTPSGKVGMKLHQLLQQFVIRNC